MLHDAFILRIPELEWAHHVFAFICAAFSTVVADYRVINWMLETTEAPRDDNVPRNTQIVVFFLWSCLCYTCSSALYAKIKKKEGGLMPPAITQTTQLLTRFLAVAVIWALPFSFSAVWLEVKPPNEILFVIFHPLLTAQGFLNFVAYSVRRDWIFCGCFSSKAGNLSNVTLNCDMIGEIQVGVVVGVGSTAVVYKCRFANTTAALKMHMRSNTSSSLHLEREVQVLASTWHPNIIRFYGTSHFKEGLGIITELAERTLAAEIRHLRQGGFTFSHVEATLTRYMHEIAQGLHHLHFKGTIHGDVKPSNCLLARDSSGGLTCKLSDFGLAVQLSSLFHRPESGPVGKGTPGFMAPELMCAESGCLGSLSEKIDIWAFGTTLWCLIELREPFEDASIFWVRDFIQSGKRLEINCKCPATLKMVVSSCWKSAPGSRPDMSSIVTWLEGTQRAEEISPDSGSGRISLVEDMELEMSHSSHLKEDSIQLGD
jgi:hypothetical protein